MKILMLLAGILMSGFFNIVLADTNDRAIIASALFKIKIENIRKANIGANFDYNIWKATPNNTGMCDGYINGHSGLDIQTKDVAGAATANRKFYAVSKGKVISAGIDSNKTIAIYDSDKNITVLYLHARKVAVSVNDEVTVGDYLGIQGDTGVPGAEHVHLEVRNGSKASPACGALTTLNPETKILEYLNSNNSSIIPMLAMTLLDEDITVDEISVGRCARLSNGTVKCWGKNNFGQLGNGTNNDSSSAVKVLGINNATDLSTYNNHGCAIVNNGQVKCWGYNRYGQLGNGNNTSSNIPVNVVGIDNAIQIDAGGNHTCVVLRNGEIKCWGINSSGQLGIGNNTSSNTPKIVSNITTATEVSASGGHTCAIVGTAVQCWGNNGSGRLGNGTSTHSNIPVLVTGLTGAKSISTGTAHSCASLTNGTINCWGNNNSRQLGNNTFVSSSTPVPVIGLSTAKSVASGNPHTCALLNSGIVKCWGANGDG